MGGGLNMGKITWKTNNGDFKEGNTDVPKSEIDILKDQNAELNLQIIDLWETLINGGLV
jgi:hypothetical protein